MLIIEDLTNRFINNPHWQAIMQYIQDNAYLWEFLCGIGILIVLIVALKISKTSIGIARAGQQQTLETSRYIYLANKWYEIKEREFQFPRFADKNMTESYPTAFSEDDLRKYEAFAWICWAHAEDIFRNGWYDKPDFKPTIKHYKDLHYKWLTDKKDEGIFASEFIDYIETL